MHGLSQIEFDNCTFRGIRALEGLAEFKSLRRVRMFQNRPEKIPTQPGKQLLLEKLVATLFRSILTELKHLETLELIKCGLTYIPEVLVDLTNLKELILWGNEIEQFPKSLVKLTSLQKLDISCCRLKEYPAVVSKLSDLKELKIWGNEDISSLPNSLGQLTLLKKLDVSSCGFQKFPEAICKLTSLKTLIMIGNVHVLPSIPRYFSQADKLGDTKCKRMQTYRLP